MTFLPKQAHCIISSIKNLPVLYYCPLNQIIIRPPSLRTKYILKLHLYPNDDTYLGNILKDTND